MGPDISFSAICKVRGADQPKSGFSKDKTKEYTLNTSLKKRICSIEVVKINIWMIIYRHTRYMDDNSVFVSLLFSYDFFILFDFRLFVKLGGVRFSKRLVFWK